MSWKRVADWAKHRPETLRLADWLGRGRGRLRWLDHLHPPQRAHARPDLSRWADQELAALWAGHATVLLRLGGLTILIDPVLSNRVGLGLGLMTLGVHRLTAPALTLEELPPLDLILLSHAHYDHLDRPTLARLSKRVPVVTAQHTRDLVVDLGFDRVTELAWGQSLRLGEVNITARPVVHWGARTFYDQHRSYNAYVLEAGRRRVLYGADTAYFEGFKDLGKVDLGILGIGAYDPYIAAHATPEQAWAMANHCRAERILPMHHSTFRLSHEPTHEPMERLMGVAGRDEQRIIGSRLGEVWSY